MASRPSDFQGEEGLWASSLSRSRTPLLAPTPRHASTTLLFDQVPPTFVAPQPSFHSHTFHQPAYRDPAQSSTAAADPYRLPPVGTTYSGSLPSSLPNWQQLGASDRAAPHTTSSARPPPLRAHGACQPCRRRHKRCDASRPCFQCRESERPELCVDGLTAFQSGVRQPRTARPRGPSDTTNRRRYSVSAGGITSLPPLAASSTTGNLSALSDVPILRPPVMQGVSMPRRRPSLPSTSSLFSDLPPLQIKPSGLTSSTFAAPPRWPSLDDLPGPASFDPLPRALAGRSILNTPLSSGLPSLPPLDLGFGQRNHLPPLSPFSSRSSGSRSSTSTSAASGRSLTLVMGTDMRIARTSDPLRMLGYHAHDMILQNLSHYMPSSDRSKWTAFVNRVLGQITRSGRPLPASPESLERIRLRDLTATIPGMGSYTASFQIRKQTGLYVDCDVKLSLRSHFGARPDIPTTMVSAVVIAKLALRDTVLPRDPFAGSLATSAGMSSLPPLPSLDTGLFTMGGGSSTGNITRSTSSQLSSISPFYPPLATSATPSLPPLFGEDFSSSLTAPEKLSSASFASRPRAYRQRRDTLQGCHNSFERSRDVLPPSYGRLPSIASWNIPRRSGDFDMFEHRQLC